MNDVELRCMFPKGTLLYTILTHVSRNKKTAWFAVVCVSSTGEIVDRTDVVGQRLGMTHHADHGLKLPGGVGMGMTIVRSLGWELHRSWDAFEWRNLR